MRINPDLVRKLMIYVEDTVSTDKLITSADIASICQILLKKKFIIMSDI